jgi:hypothetical protein
MAQPPRGQKVFAASKAKRCFLIAPLHVNRIMEGTHAHDGGGLKVALLRIYILMEGGMAKPMQVQRFDYDYARVRCAEKETAPLNDSPWACSD